MKTLILIAAILSMPVKTRVANGDVVFGSVVLPSRDCAPVQWIADDRIKRHDYFVKAETYGPHPSEVYFERWTEPGRISFRECNMADRVKVIPEVRMWWEVWE